MDPSTEMPAEVRQQPLSEVELDLIDRWWRAANYLSVGQIYLLDNPLLREPLRTEHIIGGRRRGSTSSTRTSAVSSR